MCSLVLGPPLCKLTHLRAAIYILLESAEVNRYFECKQVKARHAKRKQFLAACMGRDGHRVNVVQKYDVVMLQLAARWQKEDVAYRLFPNCVKFVSDDLTSYAK